MARVELIIDDPATRITVKAMLEAAGHIIVESDANVAVAGTAQDALQRAAHIPTLVLATAADIPAAVEAMKQGVYGYVFMPFQPGEAEIMVRRAEGLAGRAAPVRDPENDRIETLQEMEYRHILEVLRRCRNNQAEAARKLGIGRNTLWRKLKKLAESNTHDAKERRDTAS